MNAPTDSSRDRDTKTPPTIPESPVSPTVDGVDLQGLRNLRVDSAATVNTRNEKKSLIAIARGILVVVGLLGVISAVVTLLRTEVVIDRELDENGLNTRRLPSGTLDAVRAARAKAYAMSTGFVAEGLAFNAIGIAAGWFPAIYLLAGLCLYLLDFAVILVLSPGTFLNVFVILRILLIVGLYRGCSCRRASRRVTAIAPPMQTSTSPPAARGPGLS